METVNVIGLNVERIMQQRGLNMHRLSMKAQVGQSRVGDIITGKVRNPSIRTLKKLAVALEVSVDDFLVEDTAAVNE